MFQIEIYSDKNQLINQVVDKTTFEIIYKQFSRGCEVEYDYFMHVDHPIKDVKSGVEYTYIMIEENSIKDTMYVICTSDEIEKIA